MSRVTILIIDKDKNTVEVNIPSFMLRDLNIESEPVKKHKTKKELNDTVSAFINKSN
jgi:hypothetical protein